VIELLIGIAVGVALREFWPQERTLLGKLGQAASPPSRPPEPDTAISGGR